MTKELEEYKGYFYEIVIDDDPENPRDWDNLGTFVSWHRRDFHGDTTVGNRRHSNMRKCEYYFETQEELFRFIRQKDVISVPVYLYSHSGDTVRCYPFGDPWDSGQLGYIFVTKEKLRKEYKKKLVTKEMIEEAEKTLRGEIETYDQWLRNEVYGYIVYDKNHEETDTICFGYFGHKCVIEEAKSSIDWLVSQDEKKAWEALANYVEPY